MKNIMKYITLIILAWLVWLHPDVQIGNLKNKEYIKVEKLSSMEYHMTRDQLSCIYNGKTIIIPWRYILYIEKY